MKQTRYWAFVAAAGAVALSSTAFATVIYSNDFAGATGLPHNNFNLNGFSGTTGDATSKGITLAGGVGGSEAGFVTVNYSGGSFWGMDAQTGWQSTGGNTVTDLSQLSLTLAVWTSQAASVDLRISDANAGGDALTLNGIQLPAQEWTTIGGLLSTFAPNAGFEPAAQNFQVQMITRSWYGWTGTGPMELRVDDVLYQTVAVPEPALAGTLLLTGGLGLLVRRRR